MCVLMVVQNIISEVFLSKKKFEPEFEQTSNSNTNLQEI